MGRQAGRRGSGGTTAERQSGSGDGEAGDGREAGVVVVGAAATFLFRGQGQGFRLYVCFLSHPASFLFRVSLQHPLVSSPLSRETIHFSGL